VSEDVTAYPDARIEVSVSTKNHDLESGIKQLNPVLQEILQARSATTKKPGAKPRSPFGRLRFSQHLD
jgi:hypothetical protein